MTTARALARATHPGPTLALSLIGVVLGIGVGLEPWRLILLGLAFVAHHSSVGLSNDWLDAERDRAVGRQDKPIVQGLVAVSTVRAAALAALVLAVLLTIPLGWPAVLAHLLFIGCGWAYNAGLKSTPISLAAYLVGFGSLPVVVTLALPQPTLPAPWAIVAAALIGAAAHFANALPDLEGDRAAGVRGLPQLVGPRWSALIISVSLLLAVGLVVAGPQTYDAARLIAFAVVAAIAVVAGVLAATRPPTRLVFQLILAAAFITVLLLAFTGKLLLG